jgi:hypothetical protein
LLPLSKRARAKSPHPSQRHRYNSQRLSLCTPSIAR